ncbi:MAG: SDR family NAD(P)-dependent oxidoreductase [Bryobacteraceae bacterium]
MAIHVQGKRAVVTGGANGIGLAAARALAAGGAEVWIFDLANERPAEIAAGIGCRGVPVDITDSASIEVGFERVGDFDILVANAGTAAEAEFAQTSRELWDRIISVNLTGMFLSVQAAARLMMKRRQGSIVLTASTNSWDGEARLAAYNVSKHGALGILHTAANELGPYGIRINAVCPGLIRTRLTLELFGNPANAKDYFCHIPLGRGGETAEVANAIVFLASDYASFITGTTLLVDGGQMAAKYGTWTGERAEFSVDHWRLKP